MDPDTLNMWLAFLIGSLFGSCLTASLWCYKRLTAKPEGTTEGGATNRVVNAHGRVHRALAIERLPRLCQSCGGVMNFFEKGDCTKCQSRKLSRKLS